MTSDVVLTAALRNNLLSLQTTQSAIDKTQLNLATGRTVNSALDNPQNFFAAQALNNRASDLTRLLDSIGQSIQTIQAADNGVTALTSLVEQADSIANSARDTLAQGQAEARVVGDRDLRGIDDLTNEPSIQAGDTLTFSITDSDGDAVNLGAFSGAAASATATATITIAANDSIEDLINNINNLALDSDPLDPAVNIANGDQAFEASLDASGQLQIRTLNGGDFRVVFAGGAGAGNLDSEDIALASELGFGDIARSAGDQQNGPTDTSIEFSAIADVALTSTSLFRSDGAGGTELAVGSTLLSAVLQEDGTALSAGIDDTSDAYLISVNGGTQISIALTDASSNAITIQGFVDAINDNDTVNNLIQANFDATTGELTITPTDASVNSIQIGITGDGAGDALNFGFGTVDNTAAGLAVVNAGDPVLENVQVGSAAAALAALEVEYDSVRDQISELVTNGDTGYRGTNLLNGDDLLTVFNEFRTSSLTTSGVTFTADGLGLNAADFSRTSTVDGALADVRAALESVRNFGTTLANDLTVIQTRETFTQNTINTLTAGADKLTIADQNEEGAKLLALQTRQQLGVTSLALASQSQQSILRLF